LARALAAGLQTVALVFLAGDLLRHLCRGRGLAEAHFGWPQSTLRTIRRNVRWLMVIGLPLALVVWTMEQHPDLQRNSLGRLAFIVWLLAAAVFLQRVLSPDSGVLSELIAYNRGGWLDRLSFVWRPLAIGGPAVLALLAAVGYYYTAMQLVGRLQATAWLLLGAVVAWAIVLRWLLLARRQLAINQARQRREAALAQADAEAGAAAPSSDAVPELNLSAINAQTRQLIASFAVLAVMLGVWLIWVDVLPALGMLDRFIVWGEKAVEGHVTLSDAFVVPVIAVMTSIAAKNIPGLLEIAILQRLPLDSGLRYAVSAVSKYLITIVGMTAACAQMGIRWEKVQWLVAAISVGLGFGLQEIFANFISGLIILFERPVRPGDVVTVGDVTGCVTQIRIRATTITDWDRKELLVPNKELISGRVVNWTLSDRVVRITVRIGVAYGTDVARVTEILTRLVNEQTSILADPVPTVTFEGFGESTLDFVVRAMLTNLDETLKVKHQLNTKIDAEFRAAGIEIAYPQRDVHVRSLPDLLPLALDRRRTDEGVSRKRPA
jgi:potassium efflux system protein